MRAVGRPAGAVGIGVVIRGLYYWNQREREAGSSE